MKLMLTSLAAVAMMASCTASSFGQAQHRAVHDTQVKPASFCSGCGGHSSCDSGTIWGSSCNTCCTAPSCGFRPRLLPPCPNPCRTTFLGDLVLGLKHAVDTSVSNVVGTVFGCCNSCGSRVGCGCESMGSSDCGCDSGYDGEMMYESYGAPTMASPTPMMAPDQPIPPSSTGGSPDPFVDDTPDGTSSRSIMQNRSARNQTIGGGVRRMSYEEPVAEDQAGSNSKLPKFFKNYEHRPSTTLRKPTGNQARSIRR